MLPCQFSDRLGPVGVHDFAGLQRLVPPVCYSCCSEKRPREGHVLLSKPRLLLHQEVGVVAAAQHRPRAAVFRPNCEWCLRIRGKHFVLKATKNSTIYGAVLFGIAGDLHGHSLVTAGTC